MSQRLTKILMELYQQMFNRFGPQHWWPGQTKTEIIFGAILTQNTNWGNVEKALANLRREGLLNFARLRETPDSEVAAMIRPSGYFNMKTRRLKNFIEFFYQEYGGSWRRINAQPLKTLRERILSVNGIGPETADSILLYAMDRPIFVVDAYTKRILSRKGLIAPDADYDTVQRLFMENLPADAVLFNEYHALIVRAAKEHCRTRPACDGCPVKC